VAEHWSAVEDEPDVVLGHFVVLLDGGVV
jgi:hypothetical protein